MLHHRQDYDAAGNMKNTSYNTRTVSPLETMEDMDVDFCQGSTFPVTALGRGKVGSPMLSHHHPQERSSTHFTRGWVDPRTCLHTKESRTLSAKFHDGQKTPSTVQCSWKWVRLNFTQLGCKMANGSSPTGHALATNQLEHSLPQMFMKLGCSEQIVTNNKCVKFPANIPMKLECTQ